MIFAEGQVLIVKPTVEEVREKYPEADWIEQPVKVMLLQRCLFGQIDPVKVSVNGTEKSIYSFNIDRISS